MASILALNDDCLHRIVSYLDDPSSFYSIAGTCKRFLQVTKSTSHKNGPVAAKLFTWIRNRETNREEGEPRSTCVTEYQSVTLHLPSCDKNMVIDTKYFHDYIGNYDDELSIHVTCDDLDITSEGFTPLLPRDSACIGKRKKWPLLWNQ
ncbi:hypothetical protein OS493_028124 [Desmophyllum pertusum]|uniref:F-box domain-containing protein n=1 Tax=Desmophyllum pertusum TaxID=174260 RepID=A0A9W9Z9B6_9CNID|nr:hypothetical protein OS493_028124 [Desmophyllum pertusum]